MVESCLGYHFGRSAILCAIVRVQTFEVTNNQRSVIEACEACELADPEAVPVQQVPQSGCVGPRMFYGAHVQLSEAMFHDDAHDRPYRLSLGSNHVARIRAGVIEDRRFGVQPCADALRGCAVWAAAGHCLTADYAWCALGPCLFVDGRD